MLAAIIVMIKGLEQLEKEKYAGGGGRFISFNSVNSFHLFYHPITLLYLYYLIQ